MLIAESVSIDEAEKKARIKENETVHFNSVFPFLKAIYGWRPGFLHLIMATAGAGKSTLVRSLISDIGKHGQPRILIWLSEESIDTLKNQLSYVPGKTRNLMAYSEVDHPELFSNPDVAFKMFEDILVGSYPDIFIFDNITTSSLYGESFQQQYEVAVKLKVLCNKMGIPFVLVAHANSGTKNYSANIIDQNDIRGSKKIVNSAEYMFIMQGFQILNEYLNTIRIVKKRFANTDKLFFRLEYDKSEKIYYNSLGIDFDRFKELYKNANRL